MFFSLFESILDLVLNSYVVLLVSTFVISISFVTFYCFKFSSWNLKLPMSNSSTFPRL
jgi:hypothetical protein